MKVAGLLSDVTEAREIEFISKICILKDRIHFLVRRDQLKRLLDQEEPYKKESSKKAKN